MHKSQSDVRLSLTLGLIALLGITLLVALASPSVTLAWQQRSTPTPAPAVVLSPASGPSGTRVVIRGYTFTPNDVVLLTWDGNVIQPTDPEDVMVDLAGQFQASFYVPTDGLGGHTITAGTAHETATATFNLTAGAGPTNSPIGLQDTATPTTIPGEPTPRPTITPTKAIILTPNEGTRNILVRVQGYNFNANRSVSLYWDGAWIDPQNPITVRADGTFEGYFRVPANAAFGVHQVTASDGTSPNASAPFTVIQATPTNTPTRTPTRTPTNTPTIGPTNTPTETPTQTPTPSVTPTWVPLTPGSTWIPPTTAPWPTATWAPAPAPTTAPSAPTATFVPGQPTPTGQPKPTKVPESGIGFGGPGGMIFISGAGLVLAVLLLVFRGLRVKSNL